MEMLADTMRSTSQPTRVRCRMEKTAMVTLFMSISNDCLLKSHIPNTTCDECYLLLLPISTIAVIVDIVLVSKSHSILLDYSYVDVVPK